MGNSHPKTSRISMYARTITCMCVCMYGSPLCAKLVVQRKRAGASLTSWRLDSPPRPLRWTLQATLSL